MDNVRLTFLGTSSGGGPTQGRGCSSMALSFRDEVWLIDCAEGTQRQFQRANYLDVSRITKMFITHMHVDHCVGVAPFLSTLMSVFGSHAQACNNDPNRIHIEIYGTPGLRQLVRTTLNLTHMNLSGKYVVHELHGLENLPVVETIEPVHPNEIVGQNITNNEDGYWENICPNCGFRVDAGTIQHRVPCVGYVFTELASGLAAQPRRVVCLGDTSSASSLVPLCTAGGIYPSLVVHESTNAWIPTHVDQQRLYGGHRKTPHSVREKAISRGHSTPDMAGAFARSVKAERLALTHFSAMFKTPSPNHPVMREIARQATVAWGRRGVNAIAAHDLSWIDIPQVESEEVEEMHGQEKGLAGSIEFQAEDTIWEDEVWDEPMEPDQAVDSASKRKLDNDVLSQGESSRENQWKRGRGRGRGRGQWRGRGRGNKGRG